MARIEARLGALLENEWIAIDTAGFIHRDKSAFIKGTAEILATFTRRADGVFKIENCLPPTNPTYCGSGSVPKTFDGLKDLEFVTTLNSGDWIALSHRFVARIPSTIIREPATAKERFGYILCTAPLGEPTSLGRVAISGCPDGVSRVHVTAAVQSRQIHVNGEIDLQVRICLGIPTKESVRIIWPDGQEEEVHGSKAAGGGARVNLGERVGTVTIPHPKNSVQEAGQSLYETLGDGVEAAGRALKTFVSAGDRGAFTARNESVLPDVPSVEDRANAIIANSMESYVRDGLRLIKRGKTEQARDFFSKPEIFRLAGYRFELNNIVELTEISEQKIIENLHRVAARSWFLADSKLIYPSVGFLRPEIQPKDEHERALLGKWNHELALVYAEEATHGRQHFTGGLISKRACLIDRLPDPYEADVAAFFFEQGVNLSYEFMQNRYRSRAVALEIFKGYQTPGEERELLQMVRAASFDTAIVVGQNPRAAGNHLAFSLGAGSLRESELSPSGQKRRREAHKALRGEELVISKRSDGRILLEPCSPGSTIFVPDDAGYYSKLTSSRAVEPGTPIYIGRSFKVNLS